jgi:hypothetical protein
MSNYRLPIKECNKFLKGIKHEYIECTRATKKFVKRYEPLVSDINDTVLYFKTESDMLLFKLKYNV